ncbi:MAG: T9SS type A sorting domain-containing protein [Cytophagales bacterium]|nr:T9SS type A sorting domain-containing protein [Cytophagales bacterium]
MYLIEFIKHRLYFTSFAVNPFPVVTLGPDTVVCDTAFALDAGNTGAGFNWSTGESTQTIVVFTSGTYWVDVMIGGCTTRDSINVTINLTVTGTVSSTAETVLNANDGTAWVSLTTGTGPFNYAWSPGVHPDNDTIAGLVPGTYCVTVTDANNCTFTGCDSVAPGPTGLSQTYNADQSIRLYPNPNEGVFTISFTGFENENISLTIIGLHGRTVISKELTVNDELTEEVDISDLSKGMYFLKVNSSDNVFIKKILVE